MTTHNGTTPQPETDENGRPIAAVSHTAGGTLLWYNDGQLPVARHIVAAKDFEGQLILGIQTNENGN